MPVTTTAETAEALARNSASELRADETVRVELCSLVESLRELSVRLESLPVAAQALLSSAPPDETKADGTSPTLDAVLESARAVRLLSERADAISRSIEALTKPARQGAEEPPAREPSEARAESDASECRGEPGESVAPEASEDVAPGTDTELQEEPSGSRNDLFRPIFF